MICEEVQAIYSRFFSNYINAVFTNAFNYSFAVNTIVDDRDTLQALLEPVLQSDQDEYSQAYVLAALGNHDDSLAILDAISFEPSHMGYIGPTWRILGLEQSKLRQAAEFSQGGDHYNAALIYKAFEYDRLFDRQIDRLYDKGQYQAVLDLIVDWEDEKVQRFIESKRMQGLPIPPTVLELEEEIREEVTDGDRLAFGMMLMRAEVDQYPHIETVSLYEITGYRQDQAETNVRLCRYKEAGEIYLALGRDMLTPDDQAEAFRTLSLICELL